MRPQSLGLEKKLLRLDEVQFIRSWFDTPLSTGAVMPSGKDLARTMARYVDPAVDGPVIELGPGTGPVTEALVEQGVDPARLVLVEFNTRFCQLLRDRYPTATVMRGDAYGIGRLLRGYMAQPAAAVVSSLPLMTKPVKIRRQLFNEALDLLTPGAPFVQFTYAVGSPIPGKVPGVESEASERIWLNLPPARVWAYRKN